MSITLSVVIPSYNRSSVLLNTIQQLLDQSVSPLEIVVVDQTRYANSCPHAKTLSTLREQGKIRWLRQSEPSIPKAMNMGLLEAKGNRVLFLDDDIEVDKNFIAHHILFLETKQSLAHVGQIVQPWQKPNQSSNPYTKQPAVSLEGDMEFAFNSSEEAHIQNCMAGNLCVDRGSALSVGGFDERFSGAAYRFESEFCKRFCKVLNTRFMYAPRPILYHLHLSTGGTRAHANHLTSASSIHSFGDYYFAFMHGVGLERAKYMLKRLCFCWVAKFYLHKPWYVPVRILGESKGLFRAYRAYRDGQQLISPQLGTANNE